MNIYEAAKSGKRFARNKNLGWVKLSRPEQTIFVSFEDLLADDWEIENNKNQITKEQLYDAIVKTVKTELEKHPHSIQSALINTIIFQSYENICKELGIYE